MFNSVDFINFIAARYCIVVDVITVPAGLNAIFGVLKDAPLGSGINFSHAYKKACLTFERSAASLTSFTLLNSCLVHSYSQ